MCNNQLLRTFIERSGISHTNIAKALGITYVSFNSKLKGKYAFTLEEALKLKKVLDLTQNEWEAVFNEEE